MTQTVQFLNPNGTVSEPKRYSFWTVS